IHHGDHLPGQFFTGRPFPDSGGWRSPIAGLYLCGAGTHPGGEVTGAPGYNCAAAILADRNDGDRRTS
ncbi:MAG: NAD(P)/FAD-dependent oxidoreductase, partial [bacterium]|nr:NAD(P)/FAD-dependent oxidoreductase [bacterium]